MISLDEPFRFGSSGRMQLCFLLFLTGLHLTAACKLEGNQELQTITAYTGSSVLLPCYCTDLQTKPEGVTWKDGRYDWKEIRTDTEPYRNRFQLVKDQSPGNLSLIISDLNKEDGGDYRCSFKSGVYRNFRLYVKGCTELNYQDKDIMGYVGQSVVLPCSCTDLQPKPKNLRWMKGTDYEEIYPEDQKNLYRNRVQLVKDQPPGNLSLIISDLNKEDEGWYRCSVEYGVYRDIRIIIKEAPPKPPKTTQGVPSQSSTSSPRTNGEPDAATSPQLNPPKNPIIIIRAAVGGLLLLLMGLIVIIYWRYRAQRRGRTGSREGQTGRNSQQETQDYTDALYSKINPQTKLEEEQEQDDVTYSTVIHDNKTRPANKLIESEETTEYASIKLN